MLLRIPCEKLKPYDNLFWDFNNGGKKKKKEKTNYLKFPLTPMGVLTTRSAHARPSARPPIDMSGNFSAHVSGGGDFLAKSCNSKHFSVFFVS